MGRCQRHRTRNECSTQNRGGQVFRNDTYRVRSGPTSHTGGPGATSTGPHEPDAERNRGHERHLLVLFDYHLSRSSYRPETDCAVLWIALLLSQWPSNTTQAFSRSS